MFVYGLQDPRCSNEVRYIGVTDHPNRRLKQHLKDKSDTYKVHWIQSLLREGITPELEILEEVPHEIWEDEERRYIDFFRKMGHRLTNGTDGGDGVTPTKEVRAKISRSNKGKKRSDEFRRKTSERQKNKILSKEHRENLKLAAIKDWQRPDRPISKRSGSNKPFSLEHRKKLSAAHEGKHHTVETKQLLSEITRQYWANLDRTQPYRKPMTKEHRQNLRISHLNKHPSIETRKRMSISKQFAAKKIGN